MKKTAYHKVVLLLFLSVLTNFKLKAQDIEVITTVTSNPPGSNNSLNICTGETYVKTEFENINTNTAGFTNIVIQQTFPSGIGVDISNPFIMSCSTCTLSTNTLVSGETVVTYTFSTFLQNDKCEIRLKLNIPCNIAIPPSDEFNIVNACSTHVMSSASTNNINFKITIPQIIITNFEDDSGNPLPDNNNGIQHLVLFKNPTDLSITRHRKFEIKVTSGLVEGFNLFFPPESEIERTGYIKLKGISSTGSTSILTSYNYAPVDPATTPFEVNSTILNTLLGSNTMNADDIIEVYEYFYVINCSPVTSDDTHYTVDWSCPNQNSSCESFSTKRTIKVENGDKNITMSATVTPQFISQGPPSDIVYTFTNSIDGAQALGSNTKSLDHITFPFQEEWLSYNGSPLSLINPSNVTIRNPITLEAVDVTDIPGFFSYSAEVCTLNFSVLNDNPFQNQASSNPFEDVFIKDGIFNEFKEGKSFNLIFNDVNFECGDGTFYGGNLGFSSCEKGYQNNMLFNTARDIAGGGNASYFKMCDYLHLNPLNNYLEAIWTNQFPVTAFVEADRTDLHAGDTDVKIDFYYQYTGYLQNNSPFYNAIGGPQIFPCSTSAPGNITYQATISIDDLYDIGNVYYYSDPNNQGTQSLVILDSICPDPELLDNTLYKIEGLGLNGKIELNLSLDPSDPACLPGLANPDTIRARLESVCTAIECPYVFACLETHLYHHCQGGCGGGPPQSTLSFDFDRNSFGWTDHTMNTPITPPTIMDPLPAGIRTNRVYPKDLIHVTSTGTLGASSPSNITFLSFMIEYESTESNRFQFFEFDQGTFHYTAYTTGATETSIPLTFSNIDLIYDLNKDNCRTWDAVNQIYVNHPCTLMINFNLSSQEIADMQADGASYRLEMTLKVKPMMGNIPAPNYYLLPQVRGDFRSSQGGSCDTWGDNMMVQNLGISEAITIMPDAASGYAAGVCGKYFIFSTEVTGGLDGLDHFPSEFRPVIKWPDFNNSSVPQIKLGLLNNMATPPFNTTVPFTAPFQSWFTVEGRAGWDPFNPPVVVPIANGQAAEFPGFDASGTLTSWPVLEKDGQSTRMRLYGIMDNECPLPSGSSAVSVNADFPYTYRIYQSDPLLAATTEYINPLNDNVSFPPSIVRTLKLDRERESIPISSMFTPGLNNLTLEFTEVEPYGNVTADNVWLKFTVSNATITNVKKNGVAVSEVDGYWQFGSITRGFEYQISFDITLDSCIPDQPITVLTECGFNCSGYPTGIINNACMTAIPLEFEIIPKNTGMEMVVSPESFDGSLCDVFEYTVTLDNKILGDLENPSLTVTLPMSGVTIVESSFCKVINNIPCSSPTVFNTPTPNASSEVIYDLNIPAIFNNGGMPGDEKINIYIKVKGDCANPILSANLEFHAEGLKICGQEISDEDDTDNPIIFDPEPTLEVNVTPASLTANCNDIVEFDVVTTTTGFTGNIIIDVCPGSPPFVSQGGCLQWSIPTDPIGITTHPIELTVSNSSCTGNFNIEVNASLERCSLATNCPIEAIDNATVMVNCINGQVQIGGSTAFCSGGSVTLDAGSGSTFLWSTGESLQTITVTSAGSYSVTVTDFNGCINSGSTTLTTFLQSTISSIITDVSAFSGSDGEIDLSISGGTSPFNFIWSNGQTTEDIVGITAGSYSVTLTDANGCTINEIYLVAQPMLICTLSVSSNSQSVIPVTVNGGNNGAINITASNGTLPYSYLWNNSVTTEDLSGLFAGTYTVTITDANNCSIIQAYIVPEPPVNCTGFSTATQGGWGGPTTNSWAPILDTNFPLAFPNNLEVGCNTKKLVFTNAQAIRNFLPSGGPAKKLDAGIITNPPGNYQNVLAGQVVALTINVGLDPYFSTNTYPFANMYVTTGTFAGMTVQDVLDEANAFLGGCSTTYSASDLTIVTTALNQSYDNGNCNGGCNTINCTPLIETPVLYAACFPQDAVCNSGNIGGVISGVTGGTPPYSYLWNNGATTPDLINVIPGMYSVEVTDALTNSLTCYGFVNQNVSNDGAYFSYIVNGNAFDFTNLSAEGLLNATVSYSWDFDDPLSSANTSSDESPSHQFVSPGNHNVCLTVTYTNGSSSCTSNYCENICVPYHVQICGSSSQTLTFQPNAAQGKDSYVSSLAGHVNTNFGTNHDYRAEAWTVGGILTLVRSMVQFDLSSIPVGTSIQQANLLLYNNSTSVFGYPPGNHSSYSGSNASVLRKITSPWSESTVTWNNQPTTTATNQISLPQSTSGHQDYIVNVTAFTQDIVNNPTTNYGWQMRLQTETQYKVLLFSSSDHADANKHPRLIVQYTDTIQDTLAICQNSGVLLKSYTQPGLTYQWQKDGVNISGANNSTYYATIAGNYRVIVSANNCTSHSNTITVQVTSAPTANITPVNPQICQGSSVILSANATSGVTFQWKRNNVNITGSTSATLSVNQQGYYTVTVSDGNCTTTSLADTVVVKSQPSVTINPASPVLCPNTSVMLNAAGGVSYIWSTSQTTASISVGYSNTGSSIYTVTATGANGCTKSLSRTVIFDPPITLSSNVTNESPSGAGNGAIQLSVTGGMSPFSYLWNTGSVTQNSSNLTAGVYTATVTDSKNCTSQISATVNSETTECYGNASFISSIQECIVTFSDHSTTNSGNTIIGWYWFFGDGTYSLQQYPVHTYNTPGTYQVCLTLTITNGTDTCQSAPYCESIEVNCDLQPCGISPDISYDINGCSVSFSDFSSSNGNTTITGWLWDFGDNSSSMLQDPQHNYNEPGIYQVCLTVFGYNGESYCTEIICTAIEISEGCDEDCDITAGVIYNINNCKVQFIDHSSGLNNTTIVGWNWNFGDGSFSSAQNPLHTYSTPGNYTVCLTVFGESMEANCQETYCFELEVNDCSPSECSLLTAFNFTNISCNVYFVNFTTSGVNTTVTNWIWDFGDNSYSFQENPVHTYAQSGNYNVCLTVDGIANGKPCSDQFCFDIEVLGENCEPGDCIVEADFNYVIDECNLILQDNSLNGLSTSILEWTWDIGGIETVNGDMINYVLPDAGIYNVCLTIDAVNSNQEYCSSTICKEVSAEECNFSRLNQPKNTFSYTIVPNPSKGYFELKIESPLKASFDVELGNFYGQIIDRKSIEVEKGINNFGYNLNDKAKGIYTLRISNEFENHLLKIVVH